mmetsp:Transcript_40245/g.45791  ORF Transcript_40245/g.45791 Transcript_40245/m.45791 type:complete len:216 (-) Transcript_40245:314-961(-)|eukprot:CAMPEP_0194139280 /NCGR_PEP_ID=MMETSP0152-20130528/8961_1 /TAXON_ID=1049557 /ORGANISM="Thalassiothrix antarctica, Strain L6-D1" /LENGTH=215 /DNA_ID=CAMNT_0038837063 /DNA_START=38 /DNA_END=685 /DNA_ORIENTATION=+
MSDLPIDVLDEPQICLKENLLYPKEYEGHFEQLMLSREMILSVVELLAQKINEDYAGKFPMIVCVLKGGNSFYQNLLEALQKLKLGYTIEFLRVSSYEGTSSTGSVSISDTKMYDSLLGRHVILVEDIVDTGTTLSKLLPTIHEKCKVKSLEVCSLLQKKLKEPPKIKAKYTGLLIPDKFIIGYGLDYNELYRDLRDIWIISKAGIEFDKSALYD